MPKAAHCQVCNTSIANEKPYLVSRRICQGCMKADTVKCGAAGEGLCRFCFQCGRLQPLCQFDGAKRSCRNKLHSRRVAVRRCFSAATLGIRTQQRQQPMLPLPVHTLLHPAQAAAAAAGLEVQHYTSQDMAANLLQPDGAAALFQQWSTSAASEAAAMMKTQVLVQYRPANVMPCVSSADDAIKEALTAVAAASNPAAPAAALQGPASAGSHAAAEALTSIDDEVLEAMLMEALGQQISDDSVMDGSIDRSNSNRRGSSNGSRSPALPAGLGLPLAAAGGSSLQGAAEVAPPCCYPGGTGATEGWLHGFGTATPYTRNAGMHHPLMLPQGQAAYAAPESGFAQMGVAATTGEMQPGVVPPATSGMMPAGAPQLNGYQGNHGLNCTLPAARGAALTGLPAVAGAAAAVAAASGAAGLLDPGRAIKIQSLYSQLAAAEAVLAEARQQLESMSVVPGTV